ncbi:hypothetical protein VIBNIAM115_650012 [Vibrio nigripulchritudo AM115]|nr:hypothetical protein VIBNIAM115_650012 [Vibrio nigripulchritudo AM115]
MWSTKPTLAGLEGSLLRFVWLRPSPSHWPVSDNLELILKLHFKAKGSLCHP